MAPIPTRTGYGAISALVPVQSISGGPNAVIPNSGIGVSVIAGDVPQRLTRIAWRIDVAPDVPTGTVSGPTRYRVVAFAATQFPADISALQAQAFPTGARPEIPSAQGLGAPYRILADFWLDLAAGDPGLSQIADREWPDAGPQVVLGDTLCVVLTPIIDVNLSQVIVAASNANLYLEAYGCDVALSQRAPANGIGDLSAKSIPRYAVRVP